MNPNNRGHNEIDQLVLRGVSTVDYLGVEAPGQQGARPSRVGGPGEGAERSWPGWIGAQKRPYLRRAALA